MIANDRALAALNGLSTGSGRGYIGEPVSQLEHALQCAALARAAKAAPEEVLAALFHDIGHLIAPEGSSEMDGLGILLHEHLGAKWLADLGFKPSVWALVASHVDAKRYLAHRKAGYYAALSEASRGTLAFQGGPMSESEALEFEAHPQFAAKVRLRMWDEAAKLPDHEVPGLESYQGLIREHMESP
ncbi:MAG TPA: HD domain-containing protein [Polyangiales bacterium]|jgi:putative nucleotidyltransferase with HDIG domain|nr:HD domain-containing protein [Polyangiales bacterium]